MYNKFQPRDCLQRRARRRQDHSPCNIRLLLGTCPGLGRAAGGQQPLPDSQSPGAPGWLIDPMSLLSSRSL